MRIRVQVKNGVAASGDEAGRVEVAKAVERGRDSKQQLIVVTAGQTGGEPVGSGAARRI